MSGASSSQREWEQLRSMVESGAVSRSQAARILGVSRSTVGRLLSHKGWVPASETRGIQGIRKQLRAPKESFWTGQEMQNLWAAW